MTKILWITDLYTSGYSIVSKNLLPYIINNYDIYILVINTVLDKKNILEQLNFKINEKNLYVIKLPDISSKKSLIESKELKDYFYNHMIGLYQLPDLIKNINPEIIFTINDYQIIDRQIELINSIPWKGIKIGYMPIDAENYKINFFEKLNKLDHIITMNNKSKHIINNTNYNNKIHILEHPISNHFYSINNKYQIRQQFFNNKIGDDDIIIMNSNENSYRKRLDLTLKSFYLLYTHHKFKNKVYLLIKTSKYNNDNFNLEKTINDYNIEFNINLNNKIMIVTDKYDLDTLNKLYNCADLHISTTSGEGWGLTAFEFLKIGKFCFVPDNTCYSEYFPKEMLINTNSTPIIFGRQMIDKPKTANFSIIIQGIKLPIYTKIDIIEPNTFPINEIDCEKFIITKDKISDCKYLCFDSINSFCKHFNYNKYPDVFQIILHHNINDNYSNITNIISEISTINFKKRFKNYHIKKISNDYYDNLITQVKLVDTLDLSQKIYKFITNIKYYQDLIEPIQKKILTNLTDKKIGENLNKIFNEII